LWLTIGGSALLQAAQLAAGLDLARIAAVGLVCVLSVVAMIMLRRGSLRVAAWLTTSTIFGISCTSIWLGGGVEAPGTTTLVILILISAMTLERRSTIVWAALASGALVGFAMAEAQGWLPPAPERPGAQLVLIYGLHLAVAAWIVLHSTGTLRGAIGALGVRSIQLADSESRYTRLVQHLPDVIVALDARGCIVECNPAIETVFGYSPDELIGQPFTEIGTIPSELLDESLDLFRALLAGEPPALVATRIRHGDGSFRRVEVNLRLDHQADGDIRLYLVIRDVTSRVEAEEARAQLEHELVEARRLEALGRLSGGLAHDFNNLLVVILSNTELLEEEAEPSARDLLQEIRVAGEAAADLTAQLLAFAGRQVQEIGSVDVAATLSQQRGLLGRLLPPNVELEIGHDDDLPPVRGVRAQLEQVVMNLVMNAQQAMVDGGTVRVEATRVTLDEADCGRRPGTKAGPHVCISVSDTGHGMDKEIAERIFEPFYSRREGGTGLGLATVHGIVAHNGGHIRVDSEQGVGTRFEILLPQGAAAAEKEPVAVSDREISDDAQLVVLVVDDEPAVLKTVSRLLETQGMRVLQACSLETARAASEAEPGKIDVLLTDVLMPSISGPQLATDVLETRPETKVLLMSGYAADYFCDERMQPSSLRFISKPFSSEQLASKIRSLVREPTAPS
jgi:PAS domain S-box-containing protein